MMKLLRNAFRRTFAYYLYRVHKAFKAGRPIPVPHRLKSATVAAFGQRFGLTTLVETGTYYGDMIEAMKGTFQRIFSIELDPMLCARARRIFAGERHVSILQGDSGTKLAELVATLDAPCLFWLDAHFSGGITARAAIDTPIGKELACILDHRIRDHVILIDDARCFTGENGYPTLEALEQFIAERRPGWVCRTENDIIRIHRRE